ncbi:hypothetical protein L5515_016463 [Caenorhabditis briggsae]|uniref:Protein kinase domain-containing protein n=1 Tax=Caenorhabditis briggsae TaxID=6238 RepID=A0AAE9FAP5_CAEBR|nr:hypothetical protein L5515_016463 [Caenorhabditis briggsae]
MPPPNHSNYQLSATRLRVAEKLTCKLTEDQEAVEMTEMIGMEMDKEEAEAEVMAITWAGTSIQTTISIMEFCVIRKNDILNSSYKVVNMVNEGYFCVIYSAMDLKTNVQVAVKKLKYEGEGDLKSEFEYLMRLAPFQFCPTPLAFIYRVLMVTGLVSKENEILKECHDAFEKDPGTTVEDLITMITEETMFDPDALFDWELEELV